MATKNGQNEKRGGTDPAAPQSTLPYKCEAWCLCRSSMVVAFGVRGRSLFVQYKDGSVYRYPGLANHFTALYNAESVGSYVHRHIKSATFKKVKSGARKKQTAKAGQA
jgi:hypothetical protein